MRWLPASTFESRTDLWISFGAQVTDLWINFGAQVTSFSLKCCFSPDQLTRYADINIIAAISSEYWKFFDHWLIQIKMSLLQKLFVRHVRYSLERTIVSWKHMPHQRCSFCSYILCLSLVPLPPSPFQFVKLFKILVKPTWKSRLAREV